MSLVRLVRRQLHSHPVRYVLTWRRWRSRCSCSASSGRSSPASTPRSRPPRRTASSPPARSASSSTCPGRTARRSRRDPRAWSPLSPFSWFGGTTRTQPPSSPSSPCDPEVILEQYPEVVLTREERRAFLEDRASGHRRRGARRGKYGWRSGARSPAPRHDLPAGGRDGVAFMIRGIYRSTQANVDEQTMYFHTEYLEDMRSTGATATVRGASGAFVVKVADGYAGEEVAARIDALVRRRPAAHPHPDRGRVPGRLREDARQPAHLPRADRRRGPLRDLLRRDEHDDHRRARAHADDRDPEGARLPGRRPRPALRLEAVVLLRGRDRCSGSPSRSSPQSGSAPSSGTASPYRSPRRPW